MSDEHTKGGSVDSTAVGNSVVTAPILPEAFLEALRSYIDAKAESDVLGDHDAYWRLVERENQKLAYR